MYAIYKKLSSSTGHLCEVNESQSEISISSTHILENAQAPNIRKPSMTFSAKFLHVLIDRREMASK